MEYSFHEQRHFMLKYILDLFLMCLISISFTWRVCICVRERKKERRGDQCTTGNKIFLATCECVWWVKCEKIMGFWRICEWVFFCVVYGLLLQVWIFFFLLYVFAPKFMSVYVCARARVMSAYVRALCVCVFNHMAARWTDWSASGQLTGWRSYSKCFLNCPQLLSNCSTRTHPRVFCFVWVIFLNRSATLSLIKAIR